MSDQPFEWESFKEAAVKYRRRAIQELDRDRREALMVRAIAYEQLAEREEEERRLRWPKP